MVRGPWLIIMDSRLKINDKNIKTLFRMILKYGFLLERLQRVDMDITLTAANTVILLF